MKVQNKFIGFVVGLFLLKEIFNTSKEIDIPIGKGIYENFGGDNLGITGHDKRHLHVINFVSMPSSVVRRMQQYLLSIFKDWEINASNSRLGMSEITILELQNYVEAGADNRVKEILKEYERNGEGIYYTPWRTIDKNGTGLDPFYRYEETGFFAKRWVSIEEKNELYFDLIDYAICDAFNLDKQGMGLTIDESNTFFRPSFNNNYEFRFISTASVPVGDKILPIKYKVSFGSIGKVEGQVNLNKKVNIKNGGSPLNFNFFIDNSSLTKQQKQFIDQSNNITVQLDFTGLCKSYVFENIIFPRR